MGAMRKIRKQLEPEHLPALLFVPTDKFDGNVADTITVIDRKIYDRIYEAVKQALETKRKGVTRRGPL